MVRGGQAWCSGLVGLLLVAAGAAAELYDELLDDDGGYQNDNDIDPGPPLGEKKLPPRMARGQDLMLYRILKALQLQDSSNYTTFSSNRVPLADERSEQQELMPKGQVFKRLFGLPSRGQGYNSHYSRPQQKWKIKKGKVIGSQMVCYFKLCAFRSPA